MTADLSKLEQLAGEVAILAPVRRNRYAVAASIPWAVVEDIRAELERNGIDWRRLATKVRSKKPRP